MRPVVKACHNCAHCDLAVDDTPCRGCFAWSAWTRQVATASSDTLLADQRRLEWILPLISLDSDPLGLGQKRTMALGAALMLGKTDRDAIDFAMEGSP